MRDEDRSRTRVVEDVDGILFVFYSESSFFLRSIVFCMQFYCIVLDDWGVVDFGFVFCHVDGVDLGVGHF